LDEKNYGSSKKFVGENRKMNGVGAWECWNECMGTGKLLPPVPTPALPLVILEAPGADTPWKFGSQYQLLVQLQE